MPAGFIRRYPTDPTLAELTAIEGVIIIDREPPATISGINAGTVCIVGEFEDGPFAVEPATSPYRSIAGPYQVSNGQDFLNTFGSFGYTYDGVPANNPCARSRLADSALTPEYWNGNGYIAAVNKRFGGLVICRVDTSVGSVQFTRLASLSGSSAFNFDLEPGQTVIADTGLGTATATFNAAAALLNSAAGTYPSTFTGGETLTFRIDNGPAITAVFLAADQSQAQIIARLNQYAGYTAFTDQGGAITRITGRQRGTGGSVQIVAVSAALVTTATGFTPAAATIGTGNVSNIDAVTVTEAHTVISTAIAGTRVDRDAAGAIRISNVTGGGTGSILVSSTSTATAFGFPTDLQNSQPSGFAELTSGTMPVPTGFVGGETITIGIDDEPDVTVTFLVGDQTTADVISRINTTFGFTLASTPAANTIRLTGRANGGQVRIVAASAGTVLTELALSIGVRQAQALSASTLPAGTRVRTTAGLEFVTMQTLQVTAQNAGPYEVKVRHSLDDGTGTLAAVAAINTVPFPVEGASWSVTNLLPVSAALTEAAIDAKYSAAIDETKRVDKDAAKQITIIASARQSNAVRGFLKTNAVEAPREGCFGRVACIRPPLGTTTRAQARSNVAQPGVGAYRNQGVIYNYPGVRTFVSAVALRGTGGGAGFTADGILDVGSDTWLASLMSQLNPEENPGQATDLITGMLAIEANNPDVQGLLIDDYRLFRSSGICAPRFDGGDAIFQSGVTSVDPQTSPNLRNISRRRMSFYIQDSLAPRLNAFSKKLATVQRKALIIAEVKAFMDGLVSAENPSLQRIDSYELANETQASEEALGIFRLKLRVRLLSSLDFIVLDVEAGESVVISAAA